MRRNRKIVDEARADVAVVTTSTAARRPRRKGRKVEVGASLHLRREVLRQMIPQYREASSAHKRVIVDDFVRLTGYHRKYAMWLLKHGDEGHPSPVHSPRRVYEADVEEALVLIWTKANRLCSKRLIPSLPMFIDSLERHEHLHLTEECRHQLLSMSAATADRILSSLRKQGLYGLSTTQVGPYLKNQIPLRTFTDWNETQPGFLEADLVAHCGAHREGSYLYTLTLTDIATGWTECLPLLDRSPEAVLAAFERARTRFPFPILGLDTDNGGEFINEKLLAYCEREHITFTRGRPYLKNDQCFVEQKNGNIVRQIIGYGRLFGLAVYQQLDELYHALHLYGNMFQPSLKLVGTQREDKHVRRMYDAAKTPLQRFLLTQVVSAEKQQEVRDMAHALDPLRLFQQVERLQLAVFCCARDASRSPEQVSARPILVFTPSQSVAGMSPAHDETFDSADVQRRIQEVYLRKYCVAWHGTKNDPFIGVWEHIASWVIAHPQRSAGEIFRDLQHLDPERYHPCQLRTLERGVRKIRTRLLDILEACQQEVKTPGGAPVVVSQEVPESEVDHPICASHDPAHPLSHKDADEQVEGTCPMRKEEVPCPQETFCLLPTQDIPLLIDEPSQQEQSSLLSTSTDETCSARSTLTIERAIQDYLEMHQRNHRRPKTLEWHSTALGLFEQYLRTECQCILPTEITQR